MHVCIVWLMVHERCIICDSPTTPTPLLPSPNVDSFFVSLFCQVNHWLLRTLSTIEASYPWIL